MAIPSSGAVSLLDIANEFGGTAPHSINEYYGKASGIPSSGTISFSDFRGKSSGPSLTAGFWNSGTPNFYSYYGYKIPSGLAPQGSMSSTTFTPLSATITMFVSWFYTYNTGVTPSAQLNLSGTYSNSGWTSITVKRANGTSFVLLRTAATHSQASGETRWIWSNNAESLANANNEVISLSYA